MPAVKPREKIKKRFIQAIEDVSKEHYPQMLQVNILRQIGMAPTNYYKLRSTAGNYPTLDHCYELCNQFNISAEWLIEGTGIRIKQESKNTTALDLLKSAIAMIETQKNAINKPVNNSKKKKNQKGN